MYRYYIIAVAAIFIQTNAAMAITRDSIGVENNNGKKLILHRVVAKETYYSIGRRYHVSPKEILDFNDSKFLSIGIVVKVPTALPFTTANMTAASALGQITNQGPANGSAEINLIEHAVQKKENLNMLAERYGTTVNEIKRINNLRSINLQIGQILKIPAKAENNILAESSVTTQVQKPDNSAAQPPATANTTVQPDSDKKSKELNKNIDLNAKGPGEELLIHTVASNETIYSIATRYKMTIDQLKAKNNLGNGALSVGQKLLIRGQYPVKPTPAPAALPDSSNSITDPSLRYPASRYGLNQIEEKGTAVWIADPDLDPSKMLVLHRTAPIGGIIKITNPMSNRTTFAKVVGKFTENESTKDVIIVMTKAVADALGALDKRFYCNLTYGAQDATTDEEE